MQAEHLPGENPRSRPAPELDASPPQPDAPPQSLIEEQQDQQPLDPKPLVEGPQNPTRSPFAEKNG